MQKLSKLLKYYSKMAHQQPQFQ